MLFGIQTLITVGLFVHSTLRMLFGIQTLIRVGLHILSLVMHITLHNDDNNTFVPVTGISESRIVTMSASKGMYGMHAM